MKKKYLMKYNMFFANLLSTILMIVLTAFTYLLICLDIISLNFNISYFFIFIIFIILMFIYLGLHELVHGITYELFGADKNNIKYGIALEKSILFCKCGQYVDRRCFLSSVIAPFLILGIITGFISILFNWPLLYALSFINISGCSGDLMMFFWFLNRNKDIKFKEVGDSTTFILETTEELEKKKFICCKVSKILDGDIKDNVYSNKINISKGSKWIVIFFGVILILDCILFLIFR